MLKEIFDGLHTMTFTLPHVGERQTLREALAYIRDLEWQVSQLKWEAETAKLVNGHNSRLTDPDEQRRMATPSRAALKQD